MDVEGSNGSGDGFLESFRRKAMAHLECGWLSVAWRGVAGINEDSQHIIGTPTTTANTVIIRYLLCIM